MLLRSHRLLLTALVVLHLCNSALVIHHDRCPELSDGADYHQWSALLARALGDGDLGLAVDQLLSNPERAPLGIVPAVVGQALWGAPDLAVARAAGLLWLPLLLLAVYGIGARLDSPDAGVMAAGVAAALPMVLGFSRLVWLDLPLTAMTALTIHALLHFQASPGFKGALWLGVVTGAGMLVKPVLLLYVGPPALAVLAVQVMRQPARRLRLLGQVALSGLAAAGVFSVWAAQHAGAILTAFNKAQQEEGGTREILTHYLHRFHRYLSDLPLSTLGPLFASLAVVAMVVLVIRDRRRVVLVTSTWFWGALLSLPLFVHWDRYLLPAMPAVAVAVGCALCRLPLTAALRRWLPPLVCGLTCLFALQQSWFGPLLIYYGDDDPRCNRAFRDGMIRPVEGPRDRPDLSDLARFHIEPGTVGGVVPNELWPTPARPPFNTIGESLYSWLLSDIRDPPWMSILKDVKNRRPEVLEVLKLVAVMEPGKGQTVPPSEQASFQKVRAMVQRAPHRWRLIKTHVFPGGAWLRLYLNLAPKEVPVSDGLLRAW